MAKIPANLNFKETTKFCLLAAARIAHTHNTFTKNISKQTSDLQGLIDTLFNSTASPQLDINTTLEAIKQLIPDTEDYCSSLASQAQCAAICTYYSAEYILKQDIKLAEYAIDKVLESIDIYGKHIDDLTKSELAWQNELAKIIKTRSLTLEEIRAINRHHSIPSAHPDL